MYLSEYRRWLRNVNFRKAIVFIFNRELKERQPEDNEKYNSE